MDELISRQAVIDTVYDWSNYAPTDEEARNIRQVINDIKALPSVQSEIIRCKDCKYRDENWRRVSVRWLPCMDVQTGSNWYCGSAERGEQDE